MNANYSHFRMTNNLWIYEYIRSMGQVAFFSQLYKYYDWFMSKSPGWTCNITVSKSLKTDAARDLFIKIACLFISEWHGDYEFSEDFTILRGI